MGHRNKHSPCQRRQRSRRKTQETANCCPKNDNPYGIHRCLSVRIHFLPPTRSRKGIISRKCKHDTRRIDDLSCSGDILMDYQPGDPIQTHSHTCTTMIKLQIVSMPVFPSVLRNSWPMGRGSVDAKRSETDAVAKDAAINRIQPSAAVPATPIKMAKGAARAAPADYGRCQSLVTQVVVPTRPLPIRVLQNHLEKSKV